MKLGLLLAVLAVVLTVIASADLQFIVYEQVQARELAGASPATADAVASKTARRAKYIADGAAHAALLAVVLYLAQRAAVRGWALLILACAATYGMLHGIFQAACGWQAYFGGGGLLAPPGGLCERTNGWGPIVLAVAFGVVLAVLAGNRGAGS